MIPCTDQGVPPADPQRIHLFSTVVLPSLPLKNTPSWCARARAGVGILSRSADAHVTDA